MSDKFPLILALYPNARGFGYAALANPKSLIDYGVATVRPLCNTKLLHRITKFLDFCKPTVIILQDPACGHIRTGKRTIALLEQVKAHAVAQGLTVHQYTRQDIRDVFTEFKASTKYDIAQLIIKWHPQLKPQAPKFRKLWMREGYHQGMFDALSLALTFFYRQD